MKTKGSATPTDVKKVTEPNLLNINMKNILTSKCIGLAMMGFMLAPLTTSAQIHQRMMKTKNNVTSTVKGKATFAKVPMNLIKTDAAKLQRPNRTSESNDVLINEDFSKFKKGTVDKPDTTNEIVCEYDNDKGIYIDDDLMSSPGWAGSEVYSAGGAIALISHNSTTGAFLATPFGDYSGELTITMRVKPTTKEKGHNSYLIVNVMKGGFTNTDYADCTDSRTSYNYYSGPTQDWSEVTIHTKNYSADNNGFVELYVSGGLIIDDFKVTTNPSFIAKPKLLPATNFTKDGSFTANWQEVRKAFDYRFYLYKKEYISQGDTTVVENFDDVKSDGTGLGDGWVLNQTTKDRVTATGGKDGSKAIVLHDGDSFTTYYDYSKYKSLKFWGKAVYGDESEATSDDQSAINVDVLDDSGWHAAPGGFMMLNSFYSYPGDVDAESEMFWGKFAGLYYALRFTVSTPYPDASFIIDDVNIETGRAAQLKAVTPAGKNSYIPYVIATDTHFTVNSKNQKDEPYYTNLDPNGEYFYKVLSHYMGLTAETDIVPAFGVSTPDLADPTNIDERGSYTANWEAAPKATRYIANNYGVTKIKKATDNYIILDENFSKIDANVTSSTDPYNPEDLGNGTLTHFDDYTDMAGWEGEGNTMCQGMLGLKQFEYSSVYLQTPPMYLKNNNRYTVAVKAYGTVGDVLVMTTPRGENLGIEFKAVSDTTTNGVAEGSFDVDGGDAAETLVLYTYEGYPAMLDYFKVSQDLKAGDKVYTYLSSQEVKAPETSTTFSGLDKYGYSSYAYTVRAYFDQDGATAVSNPTDYQIVNLSTADGISDNISSTDNQVKVIARYAADGALLATPHKGINILKLSNGKTMKVLVK